MKITVHINRAPYILRHLTIDVHRSLDLMYIDLVPWSAEFANEGPDGREEGAVTD